MADPLTSDPQASETPARAAPPGRERIAESIRRLATQRGAEKSICPSEVARELGGESWRGLMRPVRDTAMELARQGEIEVLRKGKPVEPGEVRGVIRLRIAAR
ncbi:DUF3253 domain-containing protein [Roseomonas gilardii]|uniref:DUF3253 domain-containing protein n=1 Tax=Roseomonas gilardii TaxID=257708 RepID=UPI0004BCEE12|nr:DUF3253 domain-containing protein [Roseomonas gilardii]SUE44320.1 Protein of uncharacterised function (DUF3253) [Roseomonas gilardii subsp. rosea]